MLDPTGRFEALTLLPELAPASRFVPLVGAAPGLVNPYRDADHASEAAAPLLTVYSLKGIILPDRDRPEDEWSWDERLARPLINLASWLCLRAIHSGDPNQRKSGSSEAAALVTCSPG